MPTPLVNVLVGGRRLESHLLDRLLRLEVRESDSDPSVATLRLALSQRPTGEFVPLDDSVFAPGTAIAIEITPPGAMSRRLFDGYASHVRPHFEEIEANCYLEVIGMDIAAVLDAGDRIAAYPDMSDREAAAEVVGRYRIALKGEDTPGRQTEDGQLLVQRGSDWSFLKQLARRNGFVCYFEYDAATDAVVAWFRRPAVEEPPQADLTILRDANNLRWVDFQFTMLGPVRMVASAIDPLNKRIVRSDGALALDLLGAEDLGEQIEAGLIEAGAESVQGWLRDPFPTDVAVNAAATGATDFARFALEARGELDPALYRGILRARRPVLLKGVGRILSGIYYVRSVRTVLEEGRLSQSFIAYRNAAGQSGAEAFGQSAEEVPPA